MIKVEIAKSFFSIRIKVERELTIYLNNKNLHLIMLACNKLGIHILLMVKKIMIFMKSFFLVIIRFIEERNTVYKLFIRKCSALKFVDIFNINYPLHEYPEAETSLSELNNCPVMTT